MNEGIGDSIFDYFADTSYTFDSTIVKWATFGDGNYNL